MDMIDCDEYRDNIYRIWRSKEKKNRAIYKGRSIHLNVREREIEDMACVTSDLNISAAVLDLAIYLFNYFTDKNEDEEERIYDLCALTSIAIATKLEERDSLIPRFSDLTNFTTFFHFMNQFSKMIRFFGWNLLMPTLFTFLRFFETYALIESEICDNSYIKIFQTIQDYSNIVIKDHRFNEFVPSCLAAVCIANVQRIYSLNPIWPSHLENLTGYTYEDFQACLLFNEQL
ncbi:cyclin-J-like protein [Dinothrombium tinctorium]|uniref:Cyclin-J-like protein n=1 Tax=Dinothrombium tinctorium TaxID=1965070 RepID=A0A3S3PTG0_9ACAR|nr:cyclin-J-like protein [Dinothrombium tinctorium]RWS16032.1 cyclin-J-like protein [Dinothrombium tinctorium]RWS16052.1 cyclin-J-like protein [Dinothrombium tinctorium]RWS17233.1 cyclin-J-like protein [Dinothrombium tinctorium]RWS17436.1 cyclin-J-like protein [Dinothrombium tinctorium]